MQYAFHGGDEVYRYWDATEQIQFFLEMTSRSLQWVARAEEVSAGEEYSMAAR
jgi:hypothetical protein